LTEITNIHDSTRQDHGHTILVIDDNPTNLGVVTDYLEDYGFQIFVARNGKMGLKRAKHAQPDLILLDVLMPEMDGFETCRRLQADDTTRSIPVIFMTALADINDKVKGFEAGGVDYITKPIHQAEVLARVKTHLRIRDLTLSLQAQAKTLQKTNAELNQTLAELKETQSQLVESEKMAALGGLVAGIAHEINTPIGVGVTAASTLHDETQYFLKSYASGHLKRSELDDYIETAQTSSQLILANLQRAADLVKSFKQVAVDQSSLEYRQFLVKPYLEDILLSLTPQLKHTNHIIEITGDDQISVTSYPGALSQVVTNLVMNSLMHAYQKGQAGHLHFHLACNGDRLILEYSDDGCGMTPETLKKIYNPFFTTKQGRGGSGLGLHIVYNVVTQKMRGTIQCESQVGVGTKFMMKIPLNISTELPESAVPENVQL